MIRVLRNEEKKGIKAQPKEAVNKYGVKVGDIFVSSWGYDQTNVDFYQVIALKGTTMVELKEIGYIVDKEEHNQSMSNYIKPDKGRFIKDETLTRKIIENGLYRFIKIDSYANAYPIEKGRSYYQSWYA